MTIKELNTNRPNPFITVTLSYDEVRDMCNGLYERVEINNYEEYLAKARDYLNIYKKSATLFELIKHGKITNHLISILNKT